MAEKINIADPVYFYDDRNKYDYMFKLSTILYADDDVCLCVAKCTDESAGVQDEKILFDVRTGYVLTHEYYSWVATNDVEWAEEEDARIQQRGRE